ncbi:class E sortase, partial [Streptomyces calidiresistens]
ADPYTPDPYGATHPIAPGNPLDPARPADRRGDRGTDRGAPSPFGGPEATAGPGTDSRPREAGYGTVYGTDDRAPYCIGGTGTGGAYDPTAPRGGSHRTEAYPVGDYGTGGAGGTAVPGATDRGPDPLDARPRTADPYTPDPYGVTHPIDPGNPAGHGTDHGEPSPPDAPYGATGNRADTDAPTAVFPPTTDPHGVPADPYADPADPHAVPADPYAAPPADPETMALRRPDDLLDPGPAGGRRRRAAPPAAEDGTPDPAPAATAEGSGGGRAARRRAEKARRASRANKLANVAGELMMTTGVLLLLFVTYQLWWTNVEARAHADREANSLVDQWEGGSGEETENRDPGVFSAGEGFALLYLPTLDVRVPIAESVDEATVLDKGMVGRYSEADRLPTAMPWDEEGNFGLAGHRNTHGEPFRYINLLNEGDPIIVETETTYYIYEMRSRLDSTSPSNISVLDPIPEQGGFTEPGRYITLTTCTPEFTSTFRLIVWGEMVAEQPRGEGKPDALVT